MKNELLYDLTIVGAGPAGISLAAEARNAGVAADKILVLEKAPEHSWTIRSLYPAGKTVTANYKGVPAVCRGILCLPDMSKDQTISYLDRAIAKTGVLVHYNEEVSQIESVGSDSSPLFRITTSKGNYQSRLVVIATGIFGRPNKPDYTIPPQIRNRVHFDINSFKAADEAILVVGGGDSAAEFAQFLVHNNNNKVTLSYRGGAFRRMNEINRQSVLAMQKRGRLNILLGSDIDSLSASDSGKPLVRFKDKSLKPQSFDRIVYALGGTTPENFLKSAGISYNAQTPDVNENGESAIAGLFISGDLLAGKRGGSIASAFNASRETMNTICENYLECTVTENSLTNFSFI